MPGAVSDTGGMDELEVEEEDTGDPLVDSCVRLDVRVVQHTADVLGINFYCQLLDTNDVEAHCAEPVEESVEFKFRLRVVGFALIKENGAKVAWVAVCIGVRHELC